LTLDAKEPTTLVIEQAAAATASDLSALIAALASEDYDAAEAWLEAAQDKLSEIEGVLSGLVHHHRRGKV
jgi:hypothetical protein